MQEFFVILTKKIPNSLDIIIAKEIITDLSKWDVVVNNVEIILDAIDIYEKYKYAFWDSMVIASAIKCGAKVLLSEDFSDGQIIEGIAIKNPF